MTEIVPAEPVADLNPDRGPITSPGEPPATPPAPPADPPAPDKPPEPPQPSPFQQRLGVLTREKHDAIRERDLAARERDELRQRLEALSTPQQPAGTPPQAAQHVPGLPPGVTPADIERMVADRAEQRVRAQAEHAATQARAESWGKMIGSGQEKYTAPAFDAACADLAALGAGENRPFIDAVASADNGAAVLHYLGTNPTEAARVLALPPTRMAYEIAKLESKATAPPPRAVSRAPAPIDPIGGAAQATGDIYDPSLSPAQYAALRNKKRA